MKSKKNNYVVIALLALILVLPIFNISTNNAAPELNGSTSQTNNYLPAKNSYEDLLQHEWPQIRGDASFTGYSTGPAPEVPDILWRVSIDNLQSYLVAFNGKVFVTTTRNVIALDKDTGMIIWNTTLPSTIRWPAVYKIDDIHLVVDRYCLEIETGKILWTSDEFSAHTTYFAPGAYNPEEKMFYIKGKSTIEAWNFSDPTQPPSLSWGANVPGGGSSGSGVTYGEGKIFPGTFDSFQMALDSQTGNVLWGTETTGAMSFSGSYYQGRFLRGGPDNQFYCFNATTGEVLWTFNPRTPFGSWTVGCSTAYGNVYQVNTDGNLYAIDVETGNLVWKYQGPGHIFIAGHPVIADGKIYATTGQGSAHDPHTGEPSRSEFICLDAFTGDVLWRLPIEAYAPRESVAAAYGNLYLIPGYIQERMDIYESPNEVWAIGSKSWSMWRDNAENTGTGQTGPTDLLLRWNFSTDGAIVSSPAIVDGRVYVGSHDKKLYSLDALTGTLLWTFTTGNRIKSSPAVVDGRVYLGPDDGNIYCLDSQDGSLLWEKPAGGLIHAHLDAVSRLRSSPTVTDGRLYVGSLDKNLYCVDAKSGELLWKYPSQGYITSSPAVADGFVYFTSQEPANAALYKLDAKTGSLIWTLELDYVMYAERGIDVHASTVVAQDMVFASTNKLYYYGINASTGEIIWDYRAIFENFLVGSVSYHENKLFLIDQFFISCVEATTGEVLWKSWMGSELYGSPTYADGKLYVPTDRHVLYVLNASDGERLSWYEAKSKLWSSPSFYKGRLFIGSHDWNLYCFVDSSFSINPTSINIHINKDQIDKTVAEPIIVTGQITPSLHNVPLTINFLNPEGESKHLTTYTNKYGEYTAKFNPDVIGEWVITVFYEGREYPNRAYNPSNSEHISVHVYGEKAPPTAPPAEPIISQQGLYAIIAIVVILVVILLVYLYFRRQ